MAIDVIANMKAQVGGHQVAGDGSAVLPWAGRQADLVTQPFGKLYVAALYGYIFMGTTPDGGVAPKTDSNGTAGELSLYNPNGSGVNLVLLRVKSAYLSGTFIAGPVFLMLNTNPASAATTGTACAITSGKISGGGGTKASLLDDSTIPEVPTYGELLYNVSDWVGNTGETGREAVLDGSLIIPPGCAASVISQEGGGASPLEYHSMVWAEVPA